MDKHVHQGSYFVTEEHVVTVFVTASATQPDSVANKAQSSARQNKHGVHFAAASTSSEQRTRGKKNVRSAGKEI